MTATRSGLRSAAIRRAAVSLAALSLAAGLALACGRGDSARNDSPPALPTINGRVDPAPYRNEIEATEALLYATQPLGDDGWKNLSKNLLELHNAIVFHDSSEQARATSRKLFFLSAEVDAEPQARHRPDELLALRGVWEKIRSEQFAAADWFRASP